MPAVFGERNGSWKGGRVLARNGYVLIRVGRGHHLSDCRGYAYEHRVVAESVIGRQLQPHEVVHHVNGDKTDNRPQNIEVFPDAAHHLVRHRRHPLSLRLPGEPNPVVTCACGCGRQFLLYDSKGRRRRFVHGHSFRRGCARA